MRNERVVFGEQGAGRTIMLARNVVIPDVRLLSLCLNEVEGKVLLWSYQSALVTLQNIIRRQRSNSVREPFEIDVPDLHGIAKRFPNEERALVMEFWQVYDALVRHFLPKSTAKVYYYDGGVRGGTRFHGLAWYSREPKK